MPFSDLLESNSMSMAVLKWSNHWSLDYTIQVQYGVYYVVSSVHYTGELCESKILEELYDLMKKERGHNSPLESIHLFYSIIYVRIWYVETGRSVETFLPLSLIPSDSFFSWMHTRLRRWQPWLFWCLERQILACVLWTLHCFLSISGHTLSGWLVRFQREHLKTSQTSYQFYIYRHH